MRQPMSRTLGCILLGALVTLGQAAGAGPADESGRLARLFAVDGRDSILEEAHCGIVNGRLTAGIAFKDVARVQGLWAPPFVASDFELAATVQGQTVPTQHYTWWPYKVERSGSLPGLRVKTATVLAAGKRAGVLAMTLENTSTEAREVSVRFLVKTALDRNGTWEFAAPASSTPTRAVARGASLVLEQGGLAVVLQGQGGTVSWDPAGRAGGASFRIQPGGRAATCVAFAVGVKAEAAAESAAVADDPEGAIRQAEAEHIRQVRVLFEKLPRLEAANPALVRLYERSLVHLLMNRWDVPEFVLRLMRQYQLLFR